MPIRKVSGGGFQFGKSGKVFRGLDAAKKAAAQGAAIHATGFREEGKLEKMQRTGKHKS